VTTIGAILREIGKIALGTSIHNLDAMLVLLGAWIERTQTPPAEKYRVGTDTGTDARRGRERK
jgi:hypothetical protein